MYPTRRNVTQFIYFWKTARHVSGGISTHHQEHIQLYLQHLVLVKPLLLPAAIVEELELVWVWCGNCFHLFWCGCVSWNIVFSRDMDCLGNICRNTLHKGDNDENNNNTHFIFFPRYETPKFTNIQNNRQTCLIVLYVFIIYIFG